MNGKSVNLNFYEPYAILTIAIIVAGGSIGVMASWMTGVIEGQRMHLIIDVMHHCHAVPQACGTPMLHHSMTPSFD